MTEPTAGTGRAMASTEAQGGPPADSLGLAVVAGLLAAATLSADASVALLGAGLLTLHAILAWDVRLLGGVWWSGVLTLMLVGEQLVLAIVLVEGWQRCLPSLGLVWFLALCSHERGWPNELLLAGWLRLTLAFLLTYEGATPRAWSMAVLRWCAALHGGHIEVDDISLGVDAVTLHLALAVFVGLALIELWLTLRLWLILEGWLIRRWSSPGDDQPQAARDSEEDSSS